MSAVIMPHLPAAPAPATAPAPSATPASASPGESEFSALLGGMNPNASSAREKPQAVEPPDERADAPPTPASTLAALQSLEAALAGMGPLGIANTAANSNAAAASGAPTSGPNAQSTAFSAKLAAPLSSALAAATGEFAAGGASNASAQTPLRTQLQNDPSLGLRDLQMKTFLAVADALPARSGATALHAESSWSPFAAASARPDSEAAPASQGAQSASPGASAARPAAQLAIADSGAAAAAATANFASATASLKAASPPAV